MPVRKQIKVFVIFSNLHTIDIVRLRTLSAAGSLEYNTTQHRAKRFPNSLNITAKTKTFFPFVCRLNNTMRQINYTHMEMLAVMLAKGNT